MKIAIGAETVSGENRVALTPDSLSKLVGAGCEIAVASGCGKGAFYSDSDYESAGAKVVGDSNASFSGADVIARVLPPSESEAEQWPDGATIISTGQPNVLGPQLAILSKKKCSVFLTDLLPRISRAQSMDTLSSQASIAGYKAVLLAAGKLPKFFPMLMTAAGTIRPAKVLVMGAGVAGLQAIATAKRLGAQVSAYDVRPAVKEEVQSLGAKFVELALEAAEGEGGYAGEQTEEFQKRQRELIAEVVAASDVVITTAAIPGRQAPILVTSEMVAAMKPGSVIIDLASSTGGNCELTKDGEEVVSNGVSINGRSDLPSTMATNASQLYAKNLVNLLLPMISEGNLSVNFEDEVLAATCVIFKGEVRHGPSRELLGLEAQS